MPNPSLKSVTKQDVISLLSDLITTHSSGEDVTFDVTLVLALAGLLFNVIKMCMQSQILKQHAAVQRKPDGAVARKMKERIGDTYLEKHPDADYAEVQSHVVAAVKSFAKASEEEVLVLVRQVKSLPDADVDFDVFSEWAVGTLVNEMGVDLDRE